MSKLKKGQKGRLDGGSLQTSTFKGLLDASYDGRKSVDGFIKDDSISSKTSKVYRDPITKQVVVAHQGTKGAKDWLNNLKFAIGGTKAYKKTRRFKEAERVQRLAEEKYGAQNISTIGHSQGALQSEILGKNTKEILTLNKASNPFENRSKGANQFDVRTKNDLVSKATELFTKKKKNNGNEITLQSNSSNPLTEHSTNVLERVDPNTTIGTGIIKRRHMKRYHIIQR